GGRRQRRPVPPRAEPTSRDRRRDAAAMRRGASLGLCAALAAAPVAAAQTAAPAWTHGAVCYEVFVRSFYDSDGDGIGDLSGLIRKLDYINGLGASCIWLMPVAQSPGYHGYDVSDYYRVEPAYGTNDLVDRVGLGRLRAAAGPLLREGRAVPRGLPRHARLPGRVGPAPRKGQPDAYTVGEVWANIDAMLPYYPDQLTAYFAFELSDSLLSAVRTGSAAGLLTGFLRLEDTLPAYRWSPFLTNHDQTRALTALGGDV